MWHSALHCRFSATRSRVRFLHGALFCAQVSLGPFCVQRTCFPCAQQDIKDAEQTVLLPMFLARIWVSTWTWPLGAAPGCPGRKGGWEEEGCVLHRDVFHHGWDKLRVSSSKPGACSSFKSPLAQDMSAMK